MDKIDRLIYLDAGFISAKFEEVTGDSPPTQMTRVEGIKAGANLQIVSAGVHTQETRTFKVSALQMWQKVSSELAKYPLLDPRTFENYEGTRVCWLEGRFTLGVWKTKNGEAEQQCFELLAQGDKRIALLLNSSYLSAGFDAIVPASEALKNNIAIPAKVLARLMWHVDDASTLVACPYVIVEKSV